MPCRASYKQQGSCGEAGGGSGDTQMRTLNLPGDRIAKTCPSFPYSCDVQLRGNFPSSGSSFFYNAHSDQILHLRMHQTRGAFSLFLSGLARYRPCTITTHPNLI
jgi:hypothetical protein